MFRPPEPPPVEIQIVESDNLRVADDGSFRVGKFRLSPIGLQVEEEISEADWREAGGFLRRVESARQWWIGDWVNACESAWGETFTLAAAVSGYAKTTLTNLSSVARRVDFSLRNEKLSFGHHNLLAAKPPEEQAYWLEYAAINELSVAALGKVIDDTETEADPNILLKPERRIKQLATRTKAITRAVANHSKLTAEQRQSARDEIVIARRILDWADSLLGEE